MATKQQLFHLYVGLPPCLPRLLPAGAIAGWALHPLEKRRLVTAHVVFGPSPDPSCDRNRPGYTFTKKGSGCRTIRIHLTVQPVLSYEEAAHGGLMIKRLKWHTKGSTKHFAS
jgi:hypothetical protein